MECEDDSGMLFGSSRILAAVHTLLVLLNLCGKLSVSERPTAFHGVLE